MHLRVGSISEAEEIILICFFVKPFQKEKKPCKFITSFVTFFALVYISLDERFARQFKKLVLQNWHFYSIKAINMDYCFDLNLLLS